MRRTFILFFALAIVGAAVFNVLNGCDPEKLPTSSKTPGDVEDTIPSIWKLEIDHDTGVLMGEYHDIDITMPACSLAVGGFDLMLSYNGKAIGMINADLGLYFADCGWEYFTYRISYSDSCGPDCPGYFLRLIGLAETNNGAIHPDVQCIADGADQVLATITFFVSNDRQWECTQQPIRFYWFDCSDNTIASYGGDSLAMNFRIYDSDSIMIQDTLADLPGYHGVPDEPCLAGDVYVPIRAIDFVNGSIDIICPDSINDRGDLNINGISNEIADAILYAKYFIGGISVFEPHVDASTAASDVNGDGETLTLADLEYLIRIIRGEALPFPPQLPDTAASVTFHGGLVSINSPVDVGAVLLTFDLNNMAATPTLVVPDMSLIDTTLNNELRVLIYDIGSGYIPAGQRDILSVSATATLIGADAAGYEGNVIHVTID